MEDRDTGTEASRTGQVSTDAGHGARDPGLSPKAVSSSWPYPDVPPQVLANLDVYRDTQVSHFNFTNTQLAENFCPKSSMEQAEVELEESSDSAGQS